MPHTPSLQSGSSGDRNCANREEFPHFVCYCTVIIIPVVSCDNCGCKHVHSVYLWPLQRGYSGAVENLVPCVSIQLHHTLKTRPVRLQNVQFSRKTPVVRSVIPQVSMQLRVVFHSLTYHPRSVESADTLPCATKFITKITRTLHNYILATFLAVAV